MIASTCLAVLFVPSYFTLLQRYEEWRKKGKLKKTATAGT
jgi:HAE1 family hydrophobic/amphiphilic exporter-1